MDEIEGVGEAVTGAAMARAVEPATGAVSDDGPTHEAACLNCGTPLAGNYCQACGQRGHVHRTLTAFLHDLLHGVLHFEGKIWKTLPLLAWKPGELTRRYIEGQRARFVSPMALFLFSIFLMFAVVSSIGGPANVDTGAVQTEMADNASKLEGRIKVLEAERAKKVAVNEGTATIDRQIDDARTEATMLKNMAEGGVLKGGTVRVSDEVPAWLAVPLRRAAANPDLLLYKVQTNAYKYSWALIPISLPFMWLLFPFSRRFRLYDHMVFVTYSLAFMTLLIVIASLAYAAGLQGLAGFALMLPPLHMYRQLRGAYSLGRWSALWRTLLLVTFAVIAVGLYISALFATGMF